MCEYLIDKRYIYIDTLQKRKRNFEMSIKIQNVHWWWRSELEGEMIPDAIYKADMVEYHTQQKRKA